MIDLGVWATEGYAIPAPIKPDDLTDELTQPIIRTLITCTNYLNAF